MLMADMALVSKTVAFLAFAYFLPQLVLYIHRHLQRGKGKRNQSGTQENKQIREKQEDEKYTDQVSQSERTTPVEEHLHTLGSANVFSKETIFSEDRSLGDKVVEEQAKSLVLDALSNKDIFLSLRGQQICSLDPFWFQNQYSIVLTVLDLSHNLLSTLDGSLFIQMPVLVELRLSYNKLVEIPNEIGSQLKLLRSLYIDNNVLTSIPESIHQCSQLQVLDMSKNQLQGVPHSIGLLENLTEWNVQGNPWSKPYNDILSWLHTPRTPRRFSNATDLPTKLVKKSRHSSEISSSDEHRTASSQAHLAPVNDIPRRPSSMVDLVYDTDDSDDVKNVLEHLASQESGQRYRKSFSAGMRTPNMFSTRLGQRASSLPNSVPASSGERAPMNHLGLAFVIAYLRDLYDLDYKNVEKSISPIDPTPELLSPTDPSPKQGRLSICTQISETNPVLIEKLLNRRKNILSELLQTEEAYVKYLQSVVELYIEPLKRDTSIVSKEEHKSIFANFESILVMHRDAVLPDLKATMQSGEEHVGTVFLMLNAFIRMYSVYVNNFDHAVQELEKLLQKRKRFKQFCSIAQTNPLHTQMNLQFYLIMPVQRIPRYRLLLQDLLKHTPYTHPDYPQLAKALEEIQRRATEINERKREQESYEKTIIIQNKIKGTFKIPLVQPHRRLLREALVRVEKYTKLRIKNKVVTLKEIPIDKLSVIFLFNDILLECRPVMALPHNPQAVTLNLSDVTSLELQRTLTLSTRIQASSVVKQPWAYPISENGSGSTKSLLRIVDRDIVLYLSGPDDLLQSLAVSINNRAN